MSDEFMNHKPSNTNSRRVRLSLKPNPQPLPYKVRGAKSKPLSLRGRGLEAGFQELSRISR